MRNFTEQVFIKKDKKYVPYTPTNGWSDNKVFNKGDGIYLIDNDPSTTQEQCVLKLYDMVDLESYYKDKIMVAKEELKPIIECY